MTTVDSALLPVSGAGFRNTLATYFSFLAYVQVRENVRVNGPQSTLHRSHVLLLLVIPYHSIPLTLTEHSH
jgi:hypothetical protein